METVLCFYKPQYDAIPLSGHGKDVLSPHAYAPRLHTCRYYTATRIFADMQWRRKSKRSFDKVDTSSSSIVADWTEFSFEETAFINGRICLLIVYVRLISIWDFGLVCTAYLQLQL